jgi:hypothetical protein
MSCTPCRQELGDRPHHVMTDETLPSFGCREARDPILLYELFLFSYSASVSLLSDLVGFDLALCDG